MPPEDKSKTPHQGEPIFFLSTQQLPCLCIGPLKGYLSWLWLFVFVLNFPFSALTNLFSMMQLLDVVSMPVNVASFDHPQKEHDGWHSIQGGLSYVARLVMTSY